MKDPKQCESIEEIRECLDDIDFQVIGLLSKRMNYVKEIVKFKINEEDIVAAARQEEVINFRRKWAEMKNLDPDLMDKIFRILIRFNIEREMKIFRNEES